MEHKSNLNPKSRKGKRKMTNNYELEFTKVVKQAQCDVIYAAMDAIQAENDKMQKILQGGYDIYYHAQGESFYRIHQQRNKIWLKIHTNTKAMDLMWKTLQEFV